MNRLQILIADDHPMFRAALRSVLEHSTLADEVIIHQAGNLMDVHERLQEFPDIDLVLLDLQMPGAKGLSGLANLRGCFPSVPLFVISGSDEPHVIRRVQQLGALGFISKTESPDLILRGVAAILAGNEYFPELVHEYCPAGLDAEATELAARLACLTPHQFQVYSMVSRGMLNKQIAYDLEISLPTAKSHVTAIFKKLKIRDRKQLIVLSQKLDVEAGQV